MHTDYPIAYAAYNNNIDIRMVSTSGGVFTVIAEHLIKTKNAVVYGASFDGSFNVKHVRIDSCEDLACLRGSKYPQSTIGMCFKMAKQDLESGRFVLFVGTPCQIAGLKCFLNNDYDNLYTMDFVCHGVASDLVWRGYVEELGKRGKITNIIFKYKYKGWKKWYFRVEYENGFRQRRGHMTKFMHSYLSYANIRPSCYECRFKGLNHISDFTISDCWGIAEQDKEINDNLGLSALLVQNTRAEKLFDSIVSELTVKKYDAKKLMEGNWTAFKCVSRPSIRDKFFFMVKEKSVSEALKTCFAPSAKQWAVYYIQRLIGKEK